jgi:uncharacterized protein (TIGR04255 family)
MATAAQHAQSSSDVALPNFRDPPVTEVALSVQFDPLPGVQIHHFGLLWNEFQKRFPKVETHPPIERTVETFNREPIVKPPIQFELVNPFSEPRVWFVGASGNELVQIQRDRFVANWRRVKPEDRYPRYDHVRRLFEEQYRVFEKFAAEHKLGTIAPNQCEVTYVNQIQPGSVWGRHAEVGKVLNVMAPDFNDETLPTPELFRFSAQYVMGSPDAPIGRLHLNFQPAFRNVDRKPIFAMNLTARGRPMGDGFRGVLTFIDQGRADIVRGFRALTTKDMHKEWGLDG